MASVIAGVLLPEAATLATVPDERRRPGRLGKLAFTTAFFLVNGAVVDLFYRLSAHVFGHAATPAIVAQKVAFDQFLFTPLWLSVIGSLFAWHKHGFRLAPTRADLTDGFLTTPPLTAVAAELVLLDPDDRGDLCAAGAAAVPALRVRSRRLELDHGLHRRALTPGIGSFPTTFPTTPA